MGRVTVHPWTAICRDRKHATYHIINTDISIEIFISIYIYRPRTHKVEKRAFDFNKPPPGPGDQLWRGPCREDNAAVGPMRCIATATGGDDVHGGDADAT